MDTHDATGELFKPVLRSGASAAELHADASVLTRRWRCGWPASSARTQRTAQAGARADKQVVD